MTGADLKALRNAFAAAAQRVYDSWDPVQGWCGNEEIGGGGICHLIANEMADVASEVGFDVATVNAQVGENHVWFVAKADDGVWMVDVPWYAYERGGGYSWTKIPDVTITGGDVLIHRISSDPADFDDFWEG